MAEKRLKWYEIGFWIVLFGTATFLLIVSYIPEMPEHTVQEPHWTYGQIADIVEYQAEDGNYTFYIMRNGDILPLPEIHTDFKEGDIYVYYTEHIANIIIRGHDGFTYGTIKHIVEFDEEDGGYRFFIMNNGIILNAESIITDFREGESFVYHSGMIMEGGTQ